MKNAVLVAIAALAFAACKKDEPKQFSHLLVNGASFSSNKVTKSETKGGASSLVEEDNLFRLSFATPSLPGNAVYLLKNPSPYPEHAFLTIQYQHNVYRVTRDSVWLDFNLINGKRQYVLAPTWFESVTSEDSVLVEGVFNEP